MRHRLRYLSLALVRLGAGAAVGGRLGTGAVWLGIGLMFVGGTLVAIGWSATTPTIGAPLDGLARERKRATLSGLGTQVERILRLAEDQAAAHLAEARGEADEIVAAARAEARAILDQAEGQTGQITES